MGERADAVRSFGESLRPGLEVVISSNCLLLLAALYRRVSCRWSRRPLKLPA